jgi:hypothetical protein
MAELSRITSNLQIIEGSNAYKQICMTTAPGPEQTQTNACVCGVQLDVEDRIAPVCVTNMLRPTSRSVLKKNWPTLLSMSAIWQQLNLSLSITSFFRVFQWGGNTPSIERTGASPLGSRSHHPGPRMQHTLQWCWRCCSDQQGQEHR